MIPKLGDTIYLALPGLANPTTGAASNADSLPTAEVFEDGSLSAMAYAPTVLDLAGVGKYSAEIALTSGNGFEAGKSYNVFATATVAGVTATVKLGSFNSLGGMSLDLSQAGFVPRALDAVADGSLTLNDALVAAIAGAAGKESISDDSYLVKTPSTGTVIRTFALTLSTDGSPTARN